MTDVSMSALARQLQPFRGDFDFYAPRCLKIRTKSGQIQPLRLNRAQRHLHAVIEQQLKDTGKVRIIGNVTDMPTVSHTTVLGGAFYATGAADTLTLCAQGTLSNTKSQVVKVIAICTEASGTTTSWSPVSRSTLTACAYRPADRLRGKCRRSTARRTPRPSTA